MCYNSCMKKFLIRFLLIICCIFISVKSYAITYNVVVLPADILRVCENYYCYPEVSEIVSNDLITYFNSSDKIKSPSLQEVRKILAQNPNLKSTVKASMDKFSSRGNVDFQAMKQLARMFSANSVLLVANSVAMENASRNRSVWEILELSSALNISYPYTMETDAVLLDTVNDLVMWRGGYSKLLNSSDGSFIAQKASQSYAKYAYLQAYSKDILSKTIGQSVILRFFPKSVTPVLNTKEIKPSGSYFRYESSNPTPGKLEEKLEEPLEHDYGEMIYGI